MITTPQGFVTASFQNHQMETKTHSSPSGQAIKPPAGESETGHAGGAPSPPVPGVNLHDVCKRSANKLVIPWPNVLAATTTSRYEVSGYPKIKWENRQLLPVFPECLEEVTRTWSTPFSSKYPVQGGSVMDCVDMVGIGLAYIPPIEPLCGFPSTP